MKEFYKYLDGLYRSDAEASDLQIAMVHCHVFGLNFAELCENGTIDRLCDWFCFTWC